jgi:exosome complex component RRP40
MFSGLCSQAVCPGDEVTRVPDAGELRLGAGLRPRGDAIASLKAGVLRQTKSGKLWVETRQRRYIPAVNEPVVGTVLDRYGEASCFIGMPPLACRHVM